MFNLSCDSESDKKTDHHGLEFLGLLKKGTEEHNNTDAHNTNNNNTLIEYVLKRDLHLRINSKFILLISI